jgi:ComF family protein
LVRKQRNTFAAWHIDAAVPVPMHWFRRAVRGTNAADEAARLVARLLGVRFQVALSRSKATRMQNEIPVHERRGNVWSAFQARRSVSGKRILLVDDVVTTGATLAACRTVLVAAGASAVFVTALAKADRSENAT